MQDVLQSTKCTDHNTRTPRLPALLVPASAQAPCIPARKELCHEKEAKPVVETSRDCKRETHDDGRLMKMLGARPPQPCADTGPTKPVTNSIAAATGMKKVNE
jgi:hypothetical protein